MPDLMQDGRADFDGQLGVGELKLLVGYIEDRDLVRGHSEIVKTSIGERHPFVDAEDADTLRILSRVWSSLDNDSNILHLGSNPGREFVQNRLHNLLECRQIHGLIVPDRECAPAGRRPGAHSVATSSGRRGGLITRSYVVRFRGMRDLLPRMLFYLASNIPLGVPHVDEAPRAKPYVYS
jgi:hypothetical protein